MTLSRYKPLMRLTVMLILVTIGLWQCFGYINDTIANNHAQASRMARTLSSLLIQKVFDPLTSPPSNYDQKSFDNLEIYLKTKAQIHHVTLTLLEKLPTDERTTECVRYKCTLHADLDGDINTFIDQILTDRPLDLGLDYYSLTRIQDQAHATIHLSRFKGVS